VGTLSLNDVASAQLVPDETLGGERSLVTEDTIRGTPSDRISGGATRGRNLFHSFGEFNVETGRGAYFNNPAGVENIFSRITGGNPSQIDGRLGVIQAGSIDALGSANLFLINPNGIVFGRNSSLDVDGSFVGTTANAIRFGEEGFFSTSGAEVPQGLLIVNPSAFLFSQVNAAPIQSTSATPGIEAATTTLQVPVGRSLVLLGGDVFLNAINISAPGGRVELGGLRGVGTIALTSIGNTLQLIFPNQVARADVLITNRAGINVVSSGGGGIAINARNVEISRNSGIFSGILGTATAAAGDIDIDATGTLTLSNTGQIGNAVLGIGDSGDINISAQSVSLLNAGAIATFSVGQGDIGNVTIEADTISLSGKDEINNASGILSTIASLPGFTGIGRGGNVQLQAQRISLTDGAVIGTSNVATTGNVAQGTVGNIRVKAADSLSLSNNASITTQASGQSNAGSINIDSDNTISFTSGGRLLTSTSGQGNAGNVNVQANNAVIFDGASTNRNNSGILSSVNQVPGFTGSRQSGTVTVTTDALTVSNSASLQSNVEIGAVGEGGNIDVTANTVSLLNGGQIQSILRDADTANGIAGGRGRAGNIRINATDAFRASGRDPNVLPSAVFTSVGSGAEGKGGDIQITTGTLSLLDSGNLTASTSGRGDSGDVSVTATGPITLEETGNGYTSGIFTEAKTGSVGNAGDISIRGGSLSLMPIDSRDSRVDITSATSGQGNSGNITLHIDDALSLSQQSQIFSTVFNGGQGNAGDISITARSLTLLEGGEIASSIFRAEDGLPGGQGERAGNIKIDATDFINIDGISPIGFSSGVFANTQQGASGTGGNIDITTGQFRVANGGVVTAQTLNTSDSGNITINANSLEATGGGQVVANTLGGGNARNITLNVTGNIRLSGSDPNYGDRSIQFPDAPIANTSASSGIFATAEAGSTGDSGTITIRGARTLALRDNAQISAATFGTGTAGNIFVRDVNSISLDAATISTAVGRGAVLSNPNETRGNIAIATNSLALNNGAQITASTNGQGNAGNISIRNADTISLNDNSTISSAVRSNGQGRGGNVTLNTRLLSLDNSRITANTNGQGNAGDITLNANTFQASNGGRLITSTNTAQNAGNIILRNLDSITLDGLNSGIFANTNSSGRGGTITVNTTDLSLNNQAVISSASRSSDRQAGEAGNINITTSGTLRANNSDIGTTATRSSGGAITVTSSDIRLSGNSSISTSSGNNGGNIKLTATNDIRLFDNSDIRTDSGNNGGNIRMTAQSIVAFDDGDILASAVNRGGDIKLDTLAFFGSGYQQGIQLQGELDDNGQVDVSATGQISSGTITTPDTTFIQNSLTNLPDSSINTETLLANSCIVRSRTQSGRFTITGSGGLPERPGNVSASPYPTGEVQTIPTRVSAVEEPNRRWQMGDLIVEPQGVYQLSDGRLVISRECS
jgi:filamentous hemagglutinin family protein